MTKFLNGTSKQAKTPSFKWKRWKRKLKPVPTVKSLCFRRKNVARLHKAVERNLPSGELVSANRHEQNTSYKDIQAEIMHGDFTDSQEQSSKNTSGFISSFENFQNISSSDNSLRFIEASLLSCSYALETSASSGVVSDNLVSHNGAPDENINSDVANESILQDGLDNHSRMPHEETATTDLEMGHDILTQKVTEASVTQDQSYSTSCNESYMLPTRAKEQKKPLKSNNLDLTNVHCNSSHEQASTSFNQEFVDTERVQDCSSTNCTGSSSKELHAGESILDLSLISYSSSASPSLNDDTRSLTLLLMEITRSIQNHIQDTEEQYLEPDLNDTVFNNTDLCSPRNSLSNTDKQNNKSCPEECSDIATLLCEADNSFSAETPSQKTESPHHHTETPSQQTETTSKHTETSSEHKETTSSEHKETPSQYKELHSQYTETPFQQTVPPSQHTETQTKHTETPPHHTEILPQETETRPRQTEICAGADKVEQRTKHFNYGEDTHSQVQIPIRQSHDFPNTMHNQQPGDNLCNSGTHQCSGAECKRCSPHHSKQLECTSVKQVSSTELGQRINSSQDNQSSSEETMRKDILGVEPIPDTVSSHVATALSQLQEENSQLLNSQQTTSQEVTENPIFQANHTQEVVTSSSCESASSIGNDQEVAEQQAEGGREQVPENEIRQIDNEHGNMDGLNIRIEPGEQGEIYEDIVFHPGETVAVLESDDSLYDQQLGPQLQDDQVIQLGHEVQDEWPPWPIPTDIDFHRNGDYNFHQESDIDRQSEMRRRAEQRSRSRRP